MIIIPQDEAQSIRNWLERAHEALRAAQTLRQMGGSNGSVVNRAYYAMLYAVFASLVSHHLDIEKTGDNDDVIIALFEDKFVKPKKIQKEISKKIESAYDLCQAYDFQPFFEIRNEQAVEVMKSADEFIHTIEEKLHEK